MQRRLTPLVLAFLETFWCMVGVLAVVGAVALATGCTSNTTMVAEGKQADAVIRATTRIETRSTSILGVGTMPLASTQEIEFHFERPTKFVMLRTRHREVVELFDEPKRSWKYTYTPRLWLERDPGELSPLEIRSIDERGFESTGMVVWDQKLGLTANVGCNGVTYKRDSVSACQSRAGLVQEILFDEPVTATVARPECKPEPVDLRRGDRRMAERWHLQLPSGLCVVRFRTADGKREHRLITRGYTDAHHH